ncbi:MAG: hypothetical protein ASARMPREDX12_003904 [Alectoria sarmentosa]|nr:MAG: hypothetical protein ASARMPREDX12_003904 [Alectoria sarmentosa]
MALPGVGLLSALLPELRIRIYTYVFSTADEGLIVLRALRRGDWASDMGLPPYAILLQDPRYRLYRDKRRIRDIWPGPVEEAFHTALRWTAAYQLLLNGTHRAHTDQMISNVIFEYTGQWRNRKQISSHIQALRRISSRMPEASDRLTQQIVRAAAELREADTEDEIKVDRILGQIQNATFVLARRNQDTQYAAFADSQRRRRQSRREIQAPPKRRMRLENITLDGQGHTLLHEVLYIASQNDHELSFQPLRPLGDNFLALSSVNHRFRTEVLQYIESHLSFAFTNDTVALQSFCTLVEPIHRQQIRHIAIDIVDTDARDVPSPSTTFGIYLSTNLPNLKTVFLTLIPRDPTRSHTVGHHQWGQQTEDFLSSLGTWKATVVLSLQWKEDCDYFESKYVGLRGWRCIIRRSEVPSEYEQSTQVWPGFGEIGPGSYELATSAVTRASHKSEVALSPGKAVRKHGSHRC